MRCCRCIPIFASRTEKSSAKSFDTQESHPVTLRWVSCDGLSILSKKEGRIIIMIIIIMNERVDGHKQKSSSICKHYLSEHNSNIPPHLLEQFHVLTKCSNKFDCLIKEMLFIRKLKPSLNVQTDSIRAKVFT